MKMDLALEWLAFGMEKGFSENRVNMKLVGGADLEWWNQSGTTKKKS